MAGGRRRVRCALVTGAVVSEVMEDGAADTQFRRPYCARISKSIDDVADSEFHPAAVRIPNCVGILRCPHLAFRDFRSDSCGRPTARIVAECRMEVYVDAP
ncbi:hypothetical protein B0H14DRAFT_3161826 [Mycena olivaceomarginata]|nr:hypothetical protein B0H14DRAFT_3161826 [Mycena olivaceomarginata]